MSVPVRDNDVKSDRVNLCSYRSIWRGSDIGGVPRARFRASSTLRRGGAKPLELRTIRHVLGTTGKVGISRAAP